MQTVGQQSQDNINPGFRAGERSDGAGDARRIRIPGWDRACSASTGTTDRAIRSSGISRCRRPSGSDLNFEVGYLGSKNTRLGVPEANINQLPAADLAIGRGAAARVPNPYFGQIPASSSLGRPTIAQQQLLRPFPRFTNVALFRDNVGDSEYNALQAKLEKRFSRGLTFTFAYTFSKLIDDASSVFSQTIFTGPIADTPARRTLTTGIWKEMSRAATSRAYFRPDGCTRFRAGGRSPVGRLRDWCGCRPATRCRSRRRRTSTRASGSACSGRIASSDPNDFAESQRGAMVQHGGVHAGAAVHDRQQFAQSGARARLAECGPDDGKTFRITERAGSSFAGEVFNVSNTPPLNDPNGSFGAPHSARSRARGIRAISSLPRA